MKHWQFFLVILFTLALAACRSAPQTPAAKGAPLKVLAVESFLADVTQNVAGDRLQVQALIPEGVDPHAFEPTPRDIARIAESQVLIANGGGLEEWLDEAIQNAGGERLVIEASAGLTSRTAREGESVEGDDHAEGAEAGHGRAEGDPHFWLDPVLVIRYVENIRNGLSQVDPEGAAIYAQNSAAYIHELEQLDAWIQQQVAAIPAERRLLVTNHESFGYFADRYGFRVIGTVIPSVSSGASPSAQQLAGLVELVRQTGAPAIFLETGANPELALQIGRETGIKVVSGLFTHSITKPGGLAPTYIDIIRYNVGLIVEGLQ